MERYTTQYGPLIGINLFTLHENGGLKDCTVEEQSDLSTPYGILTPKYNYDFRTKNNYAVSFYADGTLRRVSLDQATELMTPIGTISAELIIFYKNGKIKRLFPLNGQITAYWGEKDEYQLAEELTYEFPFGKIHAKAIAISFYEDGQIKDLTFWPDDIIKLQTPLGKMNVRIGLSTYPNGNLKSIEPAYPTKVDTPIGSILAYDKNANGICGDTNSLNFTNDGKLISLVTSSNKITVIDGSQTVFVYSPRQEIDSDDTEVSFHPLQVEFYKDTVRINKEVEINIRTHKFIIEPYFAMAISQCEDCESCGNRCNKSSDDSL